MPALHATQFGVGAATEEGRKHDTDDLAQQFLLAPQTSFKLGYQAGGEAQVMERLLESFGDALRLAAVALPQYGWAEDLEGAKPKDLVTLGLRRHYNVRMPITYAVMLAGDGCR